jgi:hypothetical protein
MSDHSPKNDATIVKTDQEASAIVDKDELQLVNFFQLPKGRPYGTAAQ